MDFSLHSGNTGQIVELLLKGKVSIGLIEGPPRHRGIHVEPFMQDELVLIAPPNLKSGILSRQQLLASNLLMREHGSGSRRVVETALAKAGFRLKTFKSVMNLDSTEAIKSAVEAGLGIGCVSRWGATSSGWSTPLWRSPAPVTFLAVSHCMLPALGWSSTSFRWPNCSFRARSYGRRYITANLCWPFCR